MPTESSSKDQLNSTEVLSDVDADISWEEAATSLLTELEESSFSSPSPSKLSNTKPSVLQEHSNINSNQCIQPTLEGKIVRDLSFKPRLVTEYEQENYWEKDIEALNYWVYPEMDEFREYQRCFCELAFYHNLLLALPTGLGKTFISAVVMLNFYRWFPTGKVIFIAPTKPLLQQQRTAVIEITGIHAYNTTELNGNVSIEARCKEYRSKRIFFMTPQTLNNDLRSGFVDARSIVCLVIDEAHKATGSHAYAQVIRTILKHNSHFRVLALTATPGSTTSAVQKVIDCLHISKVIVRNEESVDIRPYVFHKNIQVLKVELTRDMQYLKADFADMYFPFFDFLRKKKVIPGTCDLKNLKSYVLLLALRKYSFRQKENQDKEKLKIFGYFKLLITCAHAMYLLDCHGIIQFYQKLHEIQTETEERKSGELYRLFSSNPFHFYMNHLQHLIANDHFMNHPKITHLTGILKEHFQQATQLNSNSRVMIFTEYRITAEQILKAFSNEKPLIRTSLFVGQANSVDSVGMSQNLQKEIISQFKAGIINVLVATCIGEEGLDIGDTDMIVCYDTSSSPIRMIQRMGRTGRKKDGKVFILVTKNSEDVKWERAKASYRRVQKVIENGQKLILKTDVPRLLPPTCSPTIRFQKLNSIHQQSFAGLTDNDKRDESQVETLGSQPRRQLPSIVDDEFEDMKSNLRIPTPEIKLRRYLADYRSTVYHTHGTSINLTKSAIVSKVRTPYKIGTKSLLDFQISALQTKFKSCTHEEIQRYKKYEGKWKRKKRKLI
ncbi:ATP-dependent 3' to 5' DNA helicase [Schizosaccharomyces cryophilus OY26]|uniref:ATP-dependent DNA helicase n=1 Tax=Schizosaccharomyces cryophilus (strain OY26 / ATCC MYA-4695 / CBS 11777 / NBRC 106824 / NRRL Y48691) TaxID=653667 RepID=S9VVC7_SCHCR|nr:ATP-dependent 3' to 5' DNA helicase [Schizosaccharomyces cryophilus OY26]EPY51738.1 ATP-dependent 3' to 5' DNA helicase [Schizosaccharomyces cryophilus OY26]